MRHPLLQRCAVCLMLLFACPLAVRAAGSGAALTGLWPGDPTTSPGYQVSGPQIEQVLHSGVSVNAPDKNGDTALMRAASFGDLLSVEYLIFKGAEVNLQNKRGTTALMDAIYYGCPESANYLIEKGAKVEVRDKAGLTALLCASEAMMMSATAANAGDSGAKTVPWQQVGLQCLQMLLEKGAHVNVKDEAGETPLFLAACGHADGDTHAVKALLAKGANPNVTVGKQEVTPLMAASGGDADAVAALLAAGAYVNARDRAGETALIVAAKKGDDASVQALAAAKGVKLNARDLLGQTALIVAAKTGDTTGVTTLAAVKGVDLNAIDQTGQTALMWCSHRGDMVGVQSLLAAGANTAIGNHNGKTAFNLAPNVATITTFLDFKK